MSGNQKGFILPLTMILSLLFLALVAHAIFLLNSDQVFYRSVISSFQLQQLRECALTDFNDQIQKNSLPETGSFVYDIGTVSYKTVTDGDQLTVLFTITSRDGKETNKMTYSLADGRPIDWIERTDP
ncbi:hypothetical protein EWI07_10955 [Sporolactobacillus sp. THM7-4]|nr:hypothetical protein EWI07_10955 [Sporolactobacillus sp. THM7-4]